MKTFRKILFATDFSAFAAHAENYAVAFASRHDAELHIVHALDVEILLHAGAVCFGFDVQKHLADIKNQARNDLRAIARNASEKGVTSVHTHLVDGRAAEGVVDKAEKLGCDLIITGAHGHGAVDHFLVGSVAERIVRFAPVPVLTIRPTEREFLSNTGKMAIKSVLCPCDLSPMSEQAVDFAITICRMFHAELTLLHVVDGHFEYPLVLPDHLVLSSQEKRQHALDRLNALASKFRDTKIHCEVVTGIPAKTILEVARDRSVDIIAMATHGHSGLTRALLGSTVEKVVRKAHVPTITIRPVAQQHAVDKPLEMVSQASS